MGDTAGLPTEEILQLQAAVFAACQKCFGAQTSGKRCAIDLRRAVDRIEVEVLVPGCAPLADDGELSWPGVDEVQCETRGDGGVLRLTKFIVTAADAD